MSNYDEPSQINVGTCEDVSMLALAQLIRTIVGFEGEIIHDLTKTDYAPRKLMDVSKINILGWHHQTELETGVRKVYAEIKNLERYAPA